MKTVKSVSGALLLTLVLAGSALTASAQDEMGSSNPEVIGLVNVAQGKVTALAGAMSDEQWAWRPAEGVRSTSEVFMHIAFANFFLPSMLGIAPPEDFPVSMGPEGPVGMAEYEGTSDRDEVMAQLEASFDHIKSALASVPADRMDEEMNVFGQTMNVRGFCIFLTTHLHEHLGQLVAYARTNDVVPPWSAGG
jgi:uncharacterized damage-inducible protein DinB